MHGNVEMTSRAFRMPFFCVLPRKKWGFFLFLGAQNGVQLPLVGGTIIAANKGRV